NRVMNFGYDWRDRQASITGAANYCIVRTYDTLNRVIQVTRNNTTVTGTLLAQSTIGFDDMGRVYQTAEYQVVSGVASNPQTSNTWFDLAGNVIKSKPAGSNGWTKMMYDGVGRTVAGYAGYSTATENYAEASTIATSIVFEQTITTYDAASNVIEVDSYQRDYNAPTTGTGSEGALNLPTGSNPTARVSFVAIYPDGVGR